MSQLVELRNELADYADRLDFTRGAGRDALQRHYIDPTIDDIRKAAVKAFGSDLTPFANKKAYPVTFTADVQAGVNGSVIVFKLGPKGFWVMGQYGAKPRLIVPKKAKGLHGDGYDHPTSTHQPVKHPGTKGKRAIDGAWRAIHRDRHDRITAAVDEVTNG